MINFKIDEMNLYKTTNRFIKNFNTLKIKLKRCPTLKELSAIDQLHYNGLKTVEEAIRKTQINNKSLVLDIGSGIGGPARYIADKTNSVLYAVEIQKELNEVAKKITINYKLKKNIKHLEADILCYDFKKLKFDNIVSWLAFYHIPDRNKLLNKLHNVLKNNGFMYVEDFYLKRDLNSIERRTLKKKFHANYLVSYDKYQQELKSQKFKVIEFIDMTKNWTLFTKNRLDNYKSSIEEQLKLHDKQTVNNVLSFYKLAYKLLSDNVLGGIKFICKK